MTQTTLLYNAKAAIKYGTNKEQVDKTVVQYYLGIMLLQAVRGLGCLCENASNGVNTLQLVKRKHAR